MLFESCRRSVTCNGEPTYVAENESRSRDSSRRRIQFSLRTAFVLMVLAAALISLWISFRQSRETFSLRWQISQLRQELGRLDVLEGNENKLHAIAIHSLSPLTWQWHSHVPSGRAFLLNVSAGKSPASDPSRGTASGSRGRRRRFRPTDLLRAGQGLVLLDFISVGCEEHSFHSDGT